jgi:transitional endoplasmic reticulum ATPase
MDGLDSKNNDKSAQMPVIVIAITHDIRLLDRAVLRPGRLDIHISISNPTDQERQELVKSLFSKSPLSLPLDFVDNIVKRTLGWSRAEIVGLWEAAAMEAVRRSCSASTVQDESSIMSFITEADLEMAFKV